MLPQSKINKAERENKHRICFWLLPFLLAITFGCASRAGASEPTCKGAAFIDSSILQHHCCRLATENNDRNEASSENQIPCTCRSQYDEKLRTAVTSASLRWYSDNGSSVPQQNTLSTHTQVAMRTIGCFPVDPTPIYLLNARLLI